MSPYTPELVAAARAVVSAVDKLAVLPDKSRPQFSPEQKAQIRQMWAAYRAVEDSIPELRAVADFPPYQDYRLENFLGFCQVIAGSDT